MIQVKDLVVQFETPGEIVKVLDGLNFSVAQGTATAGIRAARTEPRDRKITMDIIIRRMKNPMTITISMTISRIMINMMIIRNQRGILIMMLMAVERR